MNRGEMLLIAVDIAKRVGDMLRSAQMEGKAVAQKSSEIDLVTQYDEAAEALIVTRLVNHFPDHGIVAEEGGSRVGRGPWRWYVDPLDGTNNFAHGYPIYSVSLALYEADEPVLGVIYDPSRDECFQALAGRGAYLEREDGRHRLAVSHTPALMQSLLATGFPYDRHRNAHNNLRQFVHLVPQIQGIRRAGSAALDLANVAAGRLDGYWEFRLNSWDVAAGILLVREAGGQVTGMDGRAGLKLNAGPVDLIATNGSIHPLLAQQLATVA